MTMTKFSSKDDPGYRKVGEELRLLVKGIRQRLEEERQKEQKSLDNDNG